ncbi:hypothetical protein [Tessaracoccus lubricantis]|uniref:hypothetical protein n=1 Tax=Tessaracoccus lubricantis TaxID=545543 RepID=UPI0031EDCCDC
MISRRADSNFVRVYDALTNVAITAHGDNLIIPIHVDSAGVPMPLVEVEPWVWQEVGGDTRVGVRLADDGSVEAVGLNPGFTLLPAPWWLGLLVPVALASVAVLVIAVVAWPVRAIVGWRLRAPLDLPPTDRWLRVATLVAAIVALAGLALWVLAASMLLTGSGTPSDLLLRAAQLLTGLGLLGFVPTAWRAARAWGGRRWFHAVLASVIALAFVGLGAFAVSGGLLLPDITF